MPYPVLPPPPPPVVTSVVTNQAEYPAPVGPQAISAMGQPGQVSESESGAARGDRFPAPSSTSVVSPPATSAEKTESDPSAPPSLALTAVPLPSTSTASVSPVSASPPPSSIQPLASTTLGSGLSCLAPPERFAPESSALLAQGNATSTCVAPQNTPSRDPRTPDTSVRPSASREDSGILSRTIVPVPIDRDLPILEVDRSEDIYYILETFAPEQLLLPTLQQLEQQQPGPDREITAIPLDSVSSSAPSHAIAQFSGGIDSVSSDDNSGLESAGEEFERLQDLNPVESNTPLIRPSSEPIPIFVPEAGQPIPNLPSWQNEVEDMIPLLDQVGESETELRLEDIPVLDPSSTLDEDIPVSDPSSTLEIEPEFTEEGTSSDGEDGDNEQTDDAEADDAETDDAETDGTEADSVPSNPTPDAASQNLEEEATSDALEVTADRQVYDQEQQSFLAEGNALMTFRGALLQADRLRVNLLNRVVVAQGNAVLTRGDQVIRGERLEYDLIQDQGSVSNARGEVYIPQTTSDFTPTEQSDILSTEPELPLSERLANEQPVTTAISTGELIIGGGNASSSLTGGTVSRIRFEADEIFFNPDGWEATNVRLTNDPFSPPELEVRSRLVTFRRLDENRSELRARNPRAVLDQGLQIPLLRERAIFGQGDRNPAPFSIGFDEDERGGLFIERDFNLVVTNNVEFTLTPQFFLQRAWENSDGTDEVPPDLEDSDSLFDPDLYGLLGSLLVAFDAKTAFEGNMEIISFDLDDVNEDDLSGSVRLRRKIFTPIGPHELTTEYSYRDRLFNGTLGYQTIQKSYGFVFTSPVVSLGDSGVDLTYQGGIQRVNAVIAPERRDLLANRQAIEASNELDLLDDLIPVEFGRATLTRYQLAARLTRFTYLWRGTPLPATPERGLRYTPRPVVPFVAIQPSVEGIASFYSNGDTQPLLTGEISLLGQFGHFSRPYLDFVGFRIGYSRSTEGEESPFLFDRENDREVVSGGLMVQLFGPIRVGFQTSLSLSEEEEFDTTFILDYSRRTHGIALRYNPDREEGSINFRISDFDWEGTPEPFGGNPDD
ncbi:MAG: DUF3769 domain-containing protein [Leptolyngbyaceae bacterium]|nr:DUF3769 domain-containing protein [Leptolyngbyaceae bacterium]